MKRSGITLVEMLVAMAITLLLMAAVVQVFSIFGTAVADSRGMLEMADRLRQARNLLQADLGSLSRPVTSWVEDDSGGYFEYIEGPGRDKTPKYANSPTTLDPNKSRFGDFDDVLMFTATAVERPFQGRIVVNVGGTPTPQTIQSSSAEIIWACQHQIINGVAVRTVYRRELLIAPWAQSQVATAGLTLAQFQQQNDLSARLNSGGKIVLNSMDDLRLRQNRYRHQPLASNFPNVFQGYLPLTGNRQGEDMVLPNALAFDVRIYDRGAPLYNNTNGTTSVTSDDIVFGPADAGYVPSSASFPPSGTILVGYGAYVDLGYSLPSSGYSGAITPQFKGPVASKSYLTAYTYDTWPADYERDGRDQDSDGSADEGTNGFDNKVGGAFVNGIDDPGERETAAPYTASPTGIQVKLRVYEPDSRQIREMTVNQHFTR